MMNRSGSKRRKRAHRRMNKTKVMVKVVMAFSWIIQ